MRTSTTGKQGYHSSPWPGNHRAAPTGSHTQEKLPSVLVPAWDCQGSHCHSAEFWGALLGISPEIISEDIFQFTCCIITQDVAIWSMQNFYDSSIYFLSHMFQARSEYEWDKDWCGTSPCLDKTFSGEEAFVSAPEAAAFQPGTCKVSQLFSSNLHFHVVKVVSQGAAAWGTARHPVWVLWFPARSDWRAGGSWERWYCPPSREKICSSAWKTHHRFQEGSISSWSGPCTDPSHTATLHILELAKWWETPTAAWCILLSFVSQ